jgi:hypothetical protein
MEVRVEGGGVGGGSVVNVGGRWRVELAGGGDAAFGS